MKKLLIACSIFFISVQVNAQITRPMEVQKQNIKVIAPAQQLTIRNDLSSLQAQSRQLCDEVAQLQQKINESDKELQSQGASSEQAKAIALQQFSDRLAKAMNMLSNILKKMQETSTSIIGNLK